MADNSLVTRLLEGAEEWNAWIERESPSELDLRGAHLAGTKLERVSLGGADLTDARLDDAHLFEAELSYALLDGAVLARADLRCANLERVSARGANFRRADLRAALVAGADLTGADLREIYGRGLEVYEADLTLVDLSEADLSEARISGCDLSEAEFDRTILAGAHLWDSVGLESCTHSGPSWLDPSAASTIAGQPDGFFQGIGWPDRLIENWQALTAEGLSFYSCFISYSHADLVFARRLHDWLQDRGIRCWLDKHAVLPGDDLRDEIDRGIRIWDKVVLCCSKDSLTSSWVDQEIEKALQKEERLWRERREKVLALIPIRLDDFVFNGWESGKKSAIIARHVGDFRDWDGDEERFKTEFERLVKALSPDPLVRGLPPEPKL